MSIVVADDHPVFRRGLVALLGAAGFEVVGEAADAAGAVAECERARPRVAILDIAMPGGGVEAARRIRAVAPDTGVLMLSMHRDADIVRQAVAAGAGGYVLKDSEPEALIRAITAVGEGQFVLDPDAAAGMRGWAAAGAPRPFPHLSEREQQVLERVAHGLDNEAIAERLGLSVKTVQNYVSSILVKIEARDRAAAVAKARDAGL